MASSGKKYRKHAAIISRWAEKLRKTGQSEDQAERDIIQRNITKDRERIATLGRLVTRIYEDQIARRISEDNFNRILESSQKEQAELKQRVVLGQE